MLDQFVFLHVLLKLGVFIVADVFLNVKKNGMDQDVVFGLYVLEDVLTLLDFLNDGLYMCS